MEPGVEFGGASEVDSLCGDLDFVILNLDDTIKNLSRILNDYGILTGHLNNEIQNINALNRNGLIIPNNQAEFNLNNRNNALGGNFDNVLLNLNVINKSLSEFLNDNRILAGHLNYGIQNIPRLPYNYYNNNNNHIIARLVGAVQNLNKINKNISEILNGHRVLTQDDNEEGNEDDIEMSSLEEENNDVNVNEELPESYYSKYNGFNS
ncbi:8189_t:CDS:2 [Entrophospora sp. SA101]|nr:8189_t:CDS:2 [Entrophospora sp. SA101]